MKYSKNLFLLSSLFALSTGAWAEGEKILVAYFSWSSSHNTRTMAEYIAEETGGKLFDLTPQVITKYWMLPGKNWQKQPGRLWRKIFPKTKWLPMTQFLSGIRFGGTTPP